ncbi:hypothetical protein [Paenibacillus pini]|uniref:Uncharacterized protein n=1 Tax=Paenibacillus pini JCM 16418 TaxID=1236976 RepID=W7YL37_9BACL|nr:hypothetical protein [Paenibacillus pini]GAF08448.1 hypothetical protein JCM16418_2523 [Paenibacillus pini JCM 16418]
MKPVKTKSINRPRPVQPNNLKQWALLGAVLFLIAAIISLYVAWKDLSTSGTGGEVVI